MVYSTNYNLKKPEYGDTADIKDINDNTDDIDNLLHQNRTMIAPAFVSTKAYAIGDPVEYLGASYEFIEAKAAGPWDASKVTPKTAAEMGGSGTGGASALSDLDDVEITSPTNGQALLFDDDDDVWKNQTLPDASVTKTATGNPIEFTDGADAPLVKCVTEIAGSQDLHGQDKPWVGGAGVNQCNPDAPYETFDLTGGGVNRYGLSFAGGNTYTIVNNSTSSGIYYRTPKSDLSNRGTSVQVDIGTYKTVNVPADCILWVFSGIISDWQTASPNIAVNDPATVTTYSPYSNICPITAYTDGEIEVSDGDGNTTTHTTTYPSAIYRGSEDVVNGEVTSEMTLCDLSDLTWTYNSSYDLWVSNGVPNGYKAGSLLVAELYPYVPTLQTTGTEYGIRGNQRYNLWCRNYDSVNAPSGMLAYELATPTTSSVTPTNLPIKSLSGYNYIESSTGDMEVEYITEGYQQLVDLIQSSQHTYATTEQVVGKWIDGKTVYEKTYTNATEQSVSYQTWTPTVISATDIDRIVSLFMTRDADGGTYIPVVTRKENGYVEIFAAVGWTYNNITIQYTKASSNNRSLSKGATDSLKADLSNSNAKTDNLSDTELKAEIDENSMVTEQVKESPEPEVEPEEKETIEEEEDVKDSSENQTR